MKHLSYRDNELYIEDVKVQDITEEMFTPFYLYSKAGIIRRIDELKSAFSSLNPIIAYSTDALSNTNILKLMLEAGFSVHAVSFGDLKKAQDAGFAPGGIILGGPARTDEEFTKALYEKPFLIEIGSVFELEALKAVTEKKRTTQDISIRINLGIDPGTHPYFSEGQANSKFGIGIDLFERVLSLISDAHGVRLKAVGACLGSQVTSVEPFVKMANALVDLFLNAKAAGHEMQYLDIGGGLSIDYEEGEAIDLSDLTSKITPILQEVDGKIILKPGRFLVGDAGLIVTQVLGVKSAGNTNYVFVDAGMNDLGRPSLYEAYHEAVPLTIREGEEFTTDIVGPLCESGDFLGQSRPMVHPKRGEYISFLNAGAYCSSMASNYNGRRRAAEVLVDGDDFTVIRHRETWEDLYARDVTD